MQGLDRREGVLATDLGRGPNAQLLPGVLREGDARERQNQDRQRLHRMNIPPLISIVSPQR